MARAYKKTYLSSAMRNLAVMMDCGVRKYGYSIEEFYNKFLASDVSRQFASGNPRYLVGMSGAELADCVVEVSGGTVLNENNGTYTVGPEYWAGWALAEYQWYSGKRFKDIFEHVKLPEIISMYPVYHEMDISKFIETMDEKCAKALPECRLKKLRESRGLSQTELAKISGVSLRSIQMYEQRVNDIDKAQAQTIYKLSRVIGCSMEDLLEKPME